MSTENETFPSRENILAALHKFARSRAGLEFANYGDIKAYRAEQRSITRDLHHAERLLSEIGWRTSIGAKELMEATRAFSGRLTIELRGTDGAAVSYCVGQYYPTEYRRAVCAVCASALWAFWRECGYEADEIRKVARKELARAIAARWFN